MNQPHNATCGKTAFEIARHACEAAGEALLTHFRTVERVKHKGKRDIQTEVDLLSEKIIKDILKLEFPDDGIITEESAAIPGTSGFKWVVDPLDGTNNYFYGLPYFAVNIALVRDTPASGSGTTPSTPVSTHHSAPSHRHSEPLSRHSERSEESPGPAEDILLGLTYAPMQKELFWAEKGRGAFLNQKPIHVSEVKQLKNCLVGFDMGYSQEHGCQMLEAAKALWPRVHSVRLLGSGALGLAFAACGRLGAYFHQYLFPWDIAPGILLVQEAGGVVEAWGGKPISIHSGSVIAASPALIEEFHQVIRTS